jgi:hypothetical protein
VKKRKVAAALVALAAAGAGVIAFNKKRYLQGEELVHEVEETGGMMLVTLENDLAFLVSDGDAEKYRKAQEDMTPAPYRIDKRDRYAGGYHTGVWPIQNIS